MGQRKTGRGGGNGQEAAWTCVSGFASNNDGRGICAIVFRRPRLEEKTELEAKVGAGAGGPVLVVFTVILFFRFCFVCNFVFISFRSLLCAIVIIFAAAAAAAAAVAVVVLFCACVRMCVCAYDVCGVFKGRNSRPKLELTVESSTPSTASDPVRS